MEFSTKKRAHRDANKISKNKNLGYLFFIIVIIGIILFALMGCA